VHFRGLEVFILRERFVVQLVVKSHFHLRNPGSHF